MLLKKNKIKIVGCIPLALTNHTLACGWASSLPFLLSEVQVALTSQDCLRIRWCVLLSLLRSRHQDVTKRAKVFLEEMPVRDSGLGAWENQEGRDYEEARLILREGGGRKGKRSHPRAVWGRLHTARGPRPSNCPCCRPSARWPVAPKWGESAWHAAGTLLQFALLSVLLESSLIFPWLQLVNFLKPYFPLLFFFFNFNWSLHHSTNLKNSDSDLFISPLVVWKAISS